MKIVEGLKDIEEREQDLKFLDDSVDVERVFNARLLAALEKDTSITEVALLAVLGFEDEPKRCQAIMKQLEALESYGVIKKGLGGRWWRR